MSDLDRAKKMIEFSLGNYLKKLDADVEEMSDSEMQGIVGKTVGLKEALNLIESAEDGDSVDDLGVGSQTVEEFRERAKEYRQDP